jgi:hypothetical protein
MQPYVPFWMGRQYPYNEQWEVIQGDAFAAYIEMFCDCPTPVNINGWQFMFEIKDSFDASDPNIWASVLWTSAAGGECGVTALIVIPALTAAIPDGSYVFDLKYRTPSQLVQTIRRGPFNILPAVELELSLNQEVPPAGGGASSMLSPAVSPSVLTATYAYPSYRQGYG